MLDGYGNPNKGVGFFPNSIPDLNNTWESIENGTAQLNFTRIKDNYKMRTAAKHGGIMPLTQEEYDRVNAAYNQPIVYSDSKPVSVSSYDFEQEELSDINASFTNGASLVDNTEREARYCILTELQIHICSLMRRETQAARFWKDTLFHLILRITQQGIISTSI